jgi:hypothetical protein
VLVTAAFTVCVYLLRQGYEKMLDKADARCDAILDRAFYKERLPPIQVDLAKEHTERVQEQRKRAEDRQRDPTSNKIGPVDRAQASMVADFQRRKSGAIA